MGNWNISIRGIGCHHNANLKTDADRMARRFVRELREAGHIVVGAEITHGGAERLFAFDTADRMHFDAKKLDDHDKDPEGVPIATPTTPIGHGG